jgi:hypothetical protein
MKSVLVIREGYPGERIMKRLNGGIEVEADEAECRS